MPCARSIKTARAGRREDHIQASQLNESLTRREREVMTLVTWPMNKQIAHRLQISEATVKIHRGHLTNKCRRDRSRTS